MNFYTNDRSRQLDRLGKLREVMDATMVDLVVLGPGAHLAWLTGARPHADERPLLLCITPEYAGFLMPALEAESAARQTNLPFHTWADETGPENALTDLLKASGATTAQCIVLDETMRADFAGLVQAALPEARYQFTASTVGELRMRKDAEEISVLRQNAEIADGALQTAWKAMQPGMAEREVAEIVRDSFRSQGTVPLFTIVGAGENGAFPHHHTGETRLSPGDAVVMDVGGAKGGYSSDITRMALMGAPPDGYYDVHAIVERAVRAALDAARPGVAARAVDQAARQVIAEAGFGDFFVHRTGHGMGIEIHEAPYITASSETILDEGMVFSVEPGIYLPGRFGVRLEDIVILRSDGPEILSGLPRDAVTINAS